MEYVKPSVLKNHIKEVGPDIIKTPPEIFALPVGTVLKAGRVSGLKCYDCTVLPDPLEVIVSLDFPRKTAKKDDLAIVYRGPASRVEFHPINARGRRYSREPDINVTVLGFSPEIKPRRKCNANWAFID